MLRRQPARRPTRADDLHFLLRPERAEVVADGATISAGSLDDVGERSTFLRRRQHLQQLRPERLAVGSALSRPLLTNGVVGAGGAHRSDAAERLSDHVSDVATHDFGDLGGHASCNREELRVEVGTLAATWHSTIDADFSSWRKKMLNECCAVFCRTRRQRRRACTKKDHFLDRMGEQRRGGAAGGEL